MTSPVGLKATRHFDPASLTSSFWWKGDGTYWQDSARTTPATADGDPIGAWDDASGNSRHGIQATSGARPVLKTGANGLNGHPVVRFDGTDDLLTATIDAATVQRLFVVAKKRSAPASAAKTLWGFGTAGNSKLDCDTDFAAQYMYYGSQTPAAVDLGGTVTNWNILYVVVVSATSMVVRFNGGSAVASFDPLNEITTATTFSLAANAGVNSFGDYDVAEVFRTSAALTVAQSDNVGNYLADKYNLGWAPIG